MREIKFRGKHIHVFIEPHNTGLWVYGYLENDHYINSEELEGEMLVDKDTVGQYIGLKDKNGKEIYEGDIVNIEYPETMVEGAVIKYIGASFYGESNADDWELDNYYNIRVIGNIYDNPELLK